MRLRELSVPGSWEVEPVVHADSRGIFLEWFRHEPLREATGRDLTIAQANVSVSRAGVLRGIHFAAVPPGQAKFVTALRGTALDFVIDLRVGSPGFGEWDMVRLDDRSRRTVFLSEGLGHAVLSLDDDTTICYLLSEPYRPGDEYAVDVRDPAIGLEFPAELDLVLSDRDAAAPSLEQARSRGLLPTWEDCRNHLSTPEGH